MALLATERRFWHFLARWCSHCREPQPADCVYCPGSAVVCGVHVAAPGGLRHWRREAWLHVGLQDVQVRMCACGQCVQCVRVCALCGHCVRVRACACVGIVWALRVRMCVCVWACAGVCAPLPLPPCNPRGSLVNPKPLLRSLPCAFSTCDGCDNNKGFVQNKAVAENTQKVALIGRARASVNRCPRTIHSTPLTSGYRLSYKRDAE